MFAPQEFEILVVQFDALAAFSNGLPISLPGYHLVRLLRWFSTVLPAISRRLACCPLAVIVTIPDLVQAQFRRTITHEPNRSLRLYPDLDPARSAAIC